MQKTLRNLLLAGCFLIWIAIIALVYYNLSGGALSLDSFGGRLAGDIAVQPLQVSGPKTAAHNSDEVPVGTALPSPTVDTLETTATAPFIELTAEEPAPAAADPTLSAEPEQADPTPTPPPMAIDFPTPEPADIPQWRPALYEIPWAISPYDHFFFKRAIGVNTVNWPLANYRYGGMFPGTDFIHTGIDIDAPRGTPILAAADGKVAWAGYGVYSGKVDHNDPYGLAVTIEHDFGYQGKQLYTIYAHMDKILVQPGQVVKAGDELGLVGDTGLTTGPHLHFEVRWKGNYFISTMNPELWIAPPQGWGVLTGRIMNTNTSLLTEHDVVVVSKATKQTWIVRTYGPKYVNSDPYYRENMVLSDLPAGDYQVVIDYLGERLTTTVTIKPGAVTYISFVGFNGFNHAAPPDPEVEDWTAPETPEPDPVTGEVPVAPEAATPEPTILPPPYID